MKIPRHHPRIEIGGRVGIITGDIEGAVVDNIIKVNAQPEAVGQSHHADQFFFCSVAGADGAALVLVAEVQRIKQIVTHRIAAAALGGRGQPQTGVTGLGDFRDFVRHVVPGKVEQLQHGVGVKLCPAR